MAKRSLVAFVALAACSEPTFADHDAEIISRVELHFTPMGGGEAIVAVFTDPDGDGGMSGVADDIVLAPATEYRLDLRFINELAVPAEDLTDEIEAEAEEHMVFVHGEGVNGPASDSSLALVQHAYADFESDYGPDAIGEDLPVGLANTITTTDTGTSTLRLTLRHLPALNGSPQKSGELPSSLAAGEALPGDVDVDVTFVLDVQ